MKDLIKKIALNKYIYQACYRYVNFYRNDNNGNPYTNGEFEFLRRYSLNQPEFLIFDVGANIGEWTSFAHALNPEAEIHCFEPCSNTFSVLEETISSLSSQKIKVNHVALGAKPENLEILVYGETSALNSIYNRQVLGQSMAKELIRVDTLDLYCQRHKIQRVNFCKLDVEGHELEVLKGAKQLISNGAIDLIQLEYGGTYIDARILLKDIFEFFQDFPYRLFKILPTKIQPVSSYTVDLETFEYSNWIALLNRDNPLQ